MLPRLKTLDGDQITQLDKELAEDFVVHGSVGKNNAKKARKPSSEFRPFTAPAVGARGGDRFRDSRWDPSTPKAFDPFTSKEMPKGNVRLFRDDFLNNHPILLEYLVEDAHEGSPLDGMSGVVDQTRAKFRDRDEEDGVTGDGDVSAGFVGKMRNANPLRNADGTIDTSDPAAPTENGEHAATSHLVRPPTASSSSNVQTSHFSIDPSDPKTTIRKLLKHIEILMVKPACMLSWTFTALLM